MSKNNRVFVIFFSILLFLTVGMSEKAYAEQISGTVHNELVGTFDKSQTSNRTIEEMKKIARDDHNVTLLITNNQVTISENIGVSDGATLRVQNQEVPIKNGKFTVNTKKCSTSKYNFSDANVKTDVTVKNNDKTINIVNRIDYGTMIDAMDKMNQTTSSNTSSNLLGMIDNTIFLRAEASARYVGQKSGQKVSKGAHVHCNRFNGIHSNHRYYSRLNGQGWVNYYKSDCWYKHKAYKCPFTKADKKCDGLLKHRAHNCSSKGHWHITCWYRN